MAVAASIGLYALYVLIALLIVRFVMDWVMLLSRSYRPTGAVAAALEVAYSVTDPPLKALRRVIPPLPLGRMSFDLSFLVLWVTAGILISLLAPHAA
ncbi:MAG TPA: YggT family protein [Mycobacteriales bacterium]|nr:YggT family protein [Mycobacteriales bacterium]HWB65759.1 YggT family protein [Mycobacteriales bacterium]